VPAKDVVVDCPPDLIRALANGHFSLVYQPVVSARTGAVTACEALLRWEDPTRGPRQPSDFIPELEASGDIVAVGDWVFRQACAQGCLWPQTVKVAVNVSGAQLRRAELAAEIGSILDETGLPARRLELELTESMSLFDCASAKNNLDLLKSWGVRVSLDDLGTGYSSLKCLTSFPFDKIKIDRSFVQRMLASPCDASVVKAIARLGRAMDVETTAEGVEEEAQLTALIDAGCSSLQGFLISHPLPAGDIQRHLEPRHFGIRAAIPPNFAEVVRTIESLKQTMELLPHREPQA
jgi:EAL domain-containing protein (putative c-di-GMP-specific phosphodiesterase class I)